MSYDPIDISASALSAERLRMDIIANNIANINTTRDASGSIAPYKRKLVVFKPILDQALDGTQGVTVDGIIESNENMKMVYEPSHPDADGEGYVTYPNIDVEAEMVDMVSSKAAYEANITAIQTYKAIHNSALDI